MLISDKYASSYKMSHQIVSIKFSMSFPKDGVFPGLIPLINNYLTNLPIDVDTRCSLSRYLALIQKRASG